ncbi:MAG: hypothetical protein WC080_00480 [Patescibacteria group bacterium]
MDGGTGSVKVVCSDCGKVVLEMSKVGECKNHFCHVSNILAPNKYLSSPPPDFLQCDCKNVLGILAEDKNNLPAYFLINGRYKLEY